MVMGTSGVASVYILGAILRAKLATLGVEEVNFIILYIFTPSKCLKCQYQGFSTKQSVDFGASSAPLGLSNQSCWTEM